MGNISQEEGRNDPPRNESPGLFFHGQLFIFQRFPTVTLSSSDSFPAVLFCKRTGEHIWDVWSNSPTDPTSDCPKQINQPLGNISKKVFRSSLHKLLSISRYPNPAMQMSAFWWIGHVQPFPSSYCCAKRALHNHIL